MRHLVGLATALATALAIASAPLVDARALGAQETAAVKAAAEPWTSEELDNLLAPIALYPDPILAQVLIAATFPDQITEAAAYVRANGTDRIDEQNWEISVRAVAHYAPVLNLMAEGEDWTIALGQAYAEQPKDVMDAVQRLRQMANAQGNLASTEQQKVVVEREVIRIEPAQPQVIYVPTYDPAVVYFRPVYVTRAHPAYWSWGIGYPIGAWLTYDFDWWGPGVYYHGWYASGPSWVVVSRPWVVISPVYVSTRFNRVYVNRGVMRRLFDPRPLRRYTVVHRNTTFERHGRPGRNDGRDVVRGDRNDRGSDRGADRSWDRGKSPVADRGRTDDRRDGTRGQGSERRVTPLPVGGRGNGVGGGRGNTSRDRVTPISTGRDKAPVTAGAGGNNGTWNARPDRGGGSGGTGATANRTVPTPRGRVSTGSKGTDNSRSASRSTSGSVPDAVRRIQEASPSFEPSTRPRTERVSPRPETTAPRAERSAPRAERSTPRASSPRASSPRASAPRASSPSRGSSRSSGSSSARGGGGSSGGGRGGRRDQ